MSEQQSGRLMRDSRGGNHLSSAMKLFTSLGLTPSDLNVLAEIPEDEISVETLPSILMQLKSRKGASGQRGVASSEASYRGGGDRWDSSLGPGPSRGQASADFGFSSMQDVSSGRGFSSSYDGPRDRRAERPYSELSHQTSYGGPRIGPLLSDPVFMQRRMGSPPNGKVQDFLGVTPLMFPHMCSLCEFDVHSSMEWNQHIKELRHAENSRRLLDMYPDWKPGMASGRSGGLWDTPNLSPGLLGPPPMSSGHTGGMSSSWGGDRSLSGNKLGQNTLRSRVVVVKYDRRPLSDKTLFAFTEMFGSLREHLILDKKAFLEMESHEEALDVVNYYKRNPTTLYGKPVTFYLSQSLMVIEKDPVDRPVDRSAREVKSHGSKVVFFSRLPREEHKKRELLTVAERFGVVENYLFLKDEAFVQLGTVDDAEMLVKYYSRNPLIIEGRRVHLNICTKYKTLNVNHRQVAQNWRSNRSETSYFFKTSSGSREEKEEKEKNEEEEEPKKEEEEEENKEEEKEEDNQEKPEETLAADEEEEEVVSGVVQEGDDEEEAEGDAEHEEEPEGAESVKEQKEVPAHDDVIAGGVVTQVEVPEGQTEGTETEAPTDKHESKDEENAGESSEAVAAAAEEDEPTEQMDQDFLENMEDFVTLDELEEDEGDAHKDSSAEEETKKGGLRVVSIMGFRRGYNFLHELLALAKPFGKVEKHLVLDRRAEAYIQFEKEEEAIAMHKFYNRNVTATVCGRPVRIVQSLGYPTIQCGSSRVVYVGQIPNFKYSDHDIVKLAEPFGDIRKYSLHRFRRECFIEMDKAEDAEKMARACKETPLKFMGRRLLIYVSRKYRELHHGQLYSSKKRANSSSPPKSTQPSEEPPAKKLKEAEPQKEEEMKEQEEEKQEEEKKVQEEEEIKAQEEDKMEQDEKEQEMEQEQDKTEKEEMKEEEEEGKDQEEGQQEEEERTEQTSAEKPPEVSEEKKISEDAAAEVKVQQANQEPAEEAVNTSSNQNGQTEALPPADIKPSVASLPLPPHNPDTPIGVEHVKMGYYCRICFLFYSNKDTAMKNHCSSWAHYDKLQKHLEKEQTKAAKKKVKTAA